MREVVALDKPIEEVLSVGGNNNTTFSISGKALSAYYTAQAPAANRYLRVVFRVHTNAGSSDLSVTASSFNSNGAGAALIDDVAIGGTRPAEGGVRTQTLKTHPGLYHS